MRILLLTLLLVVIAGCPADDHQPSPEIMPEPEPPVICIFPSPSPQQIEGHCSFTFYTDIPGEGETNKIVCLCKYEMGSDWNCESTTNEEHYNTYCVEKGLQDGEPNPDLPEAKACIES